MQNLNSITLALLLAGSAINAQQDSIAIGSAKSQKQDTTSTRSKEYKERAFSLTFVSPIGTNGLDCYKVSNHVSINILAGVSRGVKGFEAGTLANVTLKDMEGAQFAGFANVVLGNVHGAQFSSYFNYCGKDLKGAGFAGLCNFGLGELHGGQFSAGVNINRKGGKGVQLASWTNVILGDFKGAQIAVGTNVALGTLDGAQIGMVNVAKKVKGVQVGFVNVADSVDGAAIGFLNIIKHGKHQVEISGDELFYANLSYRAGTDAFYNIFTAGFKPGSKDDLWHFGYGAGTSFKIKEKLKGEINATAHHVSTGGFYWGTSELIRLYCGVEYKIAKKISVAAGPTFNLYMSDALLSDYDTKKNIPAYHMFNRTTSDDFNVKGWVGGRVALRFF
ncbi:hypothetical protein CNR22_17235 [Sphingobacteriaceae bacterium]|nr:hypothetical protein CNR22_17235 [Sphingobacteriaceae bacterium]